MDVIKVIYIVIICIFLFVFVFLNFILINLFHKEKIVNKLRFYEEDHVHIRQGGLGKKKSPTLIKRISKLIPSVKIWEKRKKHIERQLIGADIPITVEELLTIKLLFSSFITFLAYIVLNDFVFCALMLVVGWNIPKVVINKKKKDRLILFNKQINEGTVIISNSLKAGYSFLQAVSVVVNETKDPFSKEFKKLLKEMSLGISIDDGLKNMLYRVESEDLKLIVNAIIIQKDIGGNLSEILDNISETIRDRQKISQELKTLTAQGKLSGVIVVLIPIMLGVTLYLINREYLMLLFTTKVGLFMFVVAVINQVFGIIMINKIIQVEV